MPRFPGLSLCEGLRPTLANPRKRKRIDRLPKARDVEELVTWAFRDQKVEAVAKRLWPSEGIGASPESSLAQIMALGCRVDTSSAGAMHMAVQCHEDAAVIYDAVMTLPPEAWVLVVQHGRQGSQPEWYPEGPGQWVQPLGRDGQPKKLWRDAARKTGYLGIAPKQLIGLDPRFVEEARRAYTLWWMALNDLVDMLNGTDGLGDHEALPPSAPSRPWES